MMIEVANRNSLWATIIVQELVAAGLDSICLAPGSRSTPLVIAFAKAEAAGQLKIYSHFDERSAAFFALGLAKAKERPVALLCTSGTAAANFFPAIVEAHQSAVPLIVLTADRPHELRNSGANQSIDQVRMYGSYALWSVDVALPEQEPSELLVRSLRTTVARAYAKSNGPRRGVVQLNLPFRKPLEETVVSTDMRLVEETQSSKTIFPRLLPQLDNTTIGKLSSILNSCNSGLIICGVDSPRDIAFAENLQLLAKKLSFPVVADAASGLRFSKTLKSFSAYDSFLKVDGLVKPDIIIQFGQMPTSLVLQKYIADVKKRWQVSSAGLWKDDSHSLNMFIEAGETEFCKSLVKAVNVKESSELEQVFQKLETSTWKFFNDELPKHYLDASIVHQFAKSLPENSLLFVANSLSIRHLDQFTQHRAIDCSVFANRGASGIDGNISTALGLGAAQPEKELFMLVGDLSFYHDMNGLLAIQRCGIPMTIILINNQGGGIFHRLPISEFEPVFTDQFLTPHELEFSHVAKLYGLEHKKVDNLPDFKDTFEKRNIGGSTIIEVVTSSHEDQNIFRKIFDYYSNFIEV